MEGIATEPEQPANNGEIDEFYKKTIMDMSERVLKNLAAEYVNIVRGVGSVMGGQVLDYEAKRILNGGRREGHEEGRKEGRREGHEEGRAEGIMGTVNVLRSLNYDDKASADIIQAEYQLTKEEAELYVPVTA